MTRWCCVLLLAAAFPVDVVAAPDPQSVPAEPAPAEVAPAEPVPAEAASGEPAPAEVTSMDPALAEPTIDPEEADDRLQCVDCPLLPRVNPFLGTASKPLKIGFFSAVFLIVYLLAIGWFKHHVGAGGGIVGACVGSIVVVLVVGLLAGWVAFSEYSWDSCWCRGLLPQVDGGLVKLRASDSIKQVSWALWGGLAAAVLALAVMLALFVRKPAAR